MSLSEKRLLRKRECLTLGESVLFVRIFATLLDPAPHVPENEFMPVGV